MNANTIAIARGQTRMVAHRGLSGLETENTVAAFVAAGNRSYYGIETDVHRTADGKFVVIHDDNTKRVALGDAMVVEETSFDTLRALLLGSKDGQKNRSDRRIPTLGEYIRVCRQYQKQAVLELKNAFTREDIAKIVEEIRAEGYLEHVTFISFDYENLLRLRAICPGQSAQYLTSIWTEELPARLQQDAIALDGNYHMLNAERVAQLHALGVEVNCWTCDDPRAAAELVAWGVDFITTNILE